MDNSTVHFVTVFKAFFAIMNPIANASVFIGLTQSCNASERRMIALRVLIPVGVAYGSDVAEARRLLLEAAGENELVMQDPAPVASFDDFGNDALLLTLRCFVAENRLMVWTMLREAINDKFAAAGIEIAFPQRDVHLDMGEPLRIKWDQVPPLQPTGDGST